MTPIEQAREALKPCPFCGSDNVSLSAFDAACLSCGAAHPHGGEAWNRRASPSTPVDGEGAEPTAASTIDCVGTEHMSRDVAGIERIARNGSMGPTAVEYFYARPEAEEWLRERVGAQLAETQRAWNERDGEKRKRIAAEARLAQAEGRPAVTEVNIDDIAQVLFDQRQTGYAWADAIEADAESDEGTLVSIVRDDAKAVLAALHPQSAAGEEGK